MEVISIGNGVLQKKLSMNKKFNATCTANRSFRIIGKNEDMYEEMVTDFFSS